MQTGSQTAGERGIRNVRRYWQNDSFSAWLEPKEGLCSSLAVQNFEYGSLVLNMNGTYY